MRNKHKLKGFLYVKMSNEGYDVNPDKILNWLVEFEELEEELK